MRNEKRRSKVVKSLMIVGILIIGVFNILTVSAEDETPKYGGTFMVGLPVGPVTLNPAYSSGYMDHAVAGQIYNSLMEYDPWTAEPIPELATSWDISDDGLTYTFHLVRDATWHDGEPFTAEDVVYTFEEIVIPYHPRGQTSFGWIEFEATDDYTVVMTLDHAFAPLINFFSLWYVGIVPEHIYNDPAYPDPTENPHNFGALPPIGTGPFKFVEWVSGDHITLERNPEYWRTENGNQLPYLDKIIFRFVPDKQMMVLALENGELDYIPMFAPINDIVRLNQTDEFTGLTNGAFGAMYQITFNTNEEHLATKEIRQAIAYAIDKNFIIETVGYGFEKVATSPIPSTTAWAHNFDVKKYDYNPDLAEQMLDDAGYPRSAPGAIDRFSITLIRGTTGKSSEQQIVEAFRDYLRAVGIDIKVEQYENTVYSDLVRAHDFDMFFTGGMSTAPDPNQIKSFYITSQIGEGEYGKSNRASYSNDRVDELFELGGIETDPDKRKDIYYEIQDILVEDLPVLHIGELAYPHIFRSTFVGIPAGCYGGIRERQDRVWWKLGSDVSYDSAAQAISNAEEDLIGQIPALEKLEEAKQALADGDYSGAQILAGDAVFVPEEPTPTGPSTTLYAGFALAIIIVAAVGYLVGKRS